MPNKIIPLLSGCIALFVTACGAAEEPTPTETTDKGSVPTEMSALPANAATKSATRLDIEQAWKCRGLMAAAVGAKVALQGPLPNALSAVKIDNSIYWTERSDAIVPDNYTQEQIDALTASSVQVLITPQAVEQAMPEIQACMDAQAVA